MQMTRRDFLRSAAMSAALAAVAGPAGVARAAAAYNLNARASRNFLFKFQH